MFSPYQLVFGRNPNLPNVLTDDLPALEGSTKSETIGSHINNLYASRKEFIAAESSDKIRRALRHQIRTAAQVVTTGDSVFYQINGSEKWRGPAVVLAADKNIIFIKQGSNFIRVHPCRVVLSRGVKLARDEGAKLAENVSSKENKRDLAKEVHNMHDSDDENDGHTTQTTPQDPEIEPTDEMRSKGEKPKVKTTVLFKRSGENDWKRGKVQFCWKANRKK